MRALPLITLGMLLLGASPACDTKLAPSSGSNAPAAAAPKAMDSAEGGAVREAAPVDGAATAPDAAQGGAPAQPTGAETPVEAPEAGSDFTPMGTADERVACEANADCVVTKWRDGSCCPSLCSARFALNAEFAEALRSKREAVCERGCPVARCAKPTETYAARCVEKRCEVYAQPISDAG